MAAEGIGGRLAAKVGPLPVWGWAVGLLVLWFAYQHFHSSSGGSASQGTGQPDPNAANPVPGFDAASEVGGGGSGFGTPTPDTITNNYYYGTTAAGQAAGGGTSNGAVPTPSSSPTQPRQVDVTVSPNIVSSDIVTSPARQTSPFIPSSVPRQTSDFVSSTGRASGTIAPVRASGGFRPSGGKTPTGIL